MPFDEIEAKLFNHFGWEEKQTYGRAEANASNE